MNIARYITSRWMVASDNFCHFSLYTILESAKIVEWFFSNNPLVNRTFPFPNGIFQLKTLTTDFHHPNRTFCNDWFMQSLYKNGCISQSWLRSIAKLNNTSTVYLTIFISHPILNFSNESRWVEGNNTHKYKTQTMDRQNNCLKLYSVSGCLCTAQRHTSSLDKSVWMLTKCVLHST